MTAQLCQCGCGQPAPVIKKTSRAQGYVKGQSHSFVNGHCRRAPRSSRYGVDESRGCWNWNRSVSAAGYPLGTMSAGSTHRQMIAHRLFYEEAHGPIPDGLVIDHTCSNRRCVNPAHLEAVTQKENIRRALAKKG